MQGYVVTGVRDTVSLIDPASQDPLRITASAQVSGTYGVVGSTAAAWSIANFGTVTGARGASGGGSYGYGIMLAAGGRITNGSEGDPLARISGADSAIDIRVAAGSIVNHGTIAGAARYGIRLEAGGSIVNGAPDGNAALITAQGQSYNGRAYDARAVIGVGGAAGTVTNFGTIAGAAYDAVSLLAGGSVKNGSKTDRTGLISASSVGVLMDGGGSVVNDGTIAGNIGVDHALATAGLTVTNAGTITGSDGVAVLLASGDRLVVDPGAVFQGIAVARGGGAVLELAHGATAGSLNGIGQSFAGFSTIALDAHAHWQIGGTDALVAGTTLALDAGARLDVTGTLQAAGGLVLTGTGTLATSAAAGGSIEIGSGALGPMPGTITVDYITDLTASGTLAGPVLNDGTINLAGGTLALTGRVLGSGTLSFLPGHAATLDLTDARPQVAISGFGAGDTIELQRIAGSALSYRSDPLGGGVLSVLGAGVTLARLDFVGSFTAADFHIAAGGQGSTLLSFGSPSAAAQTGLLHPIGYR